MGRFGSRVLGAEKVAEDNARAKKNPGHRFGPRVLGEVLQRKADIVEEEKGESLAAKKARASRKAQKDAAETRAADSAADEPTTVVEKVEAPVTASLSEMQEALDGNPAFYEKLYGSELERAEGPRKGALRMFLAHELDNADRTERVEEIQLLLKG